MESFSWQYTAALHGSYIVDIVSRARLLCRHWSVSVDHWQWRVKTRLRGCGEWRYDCAAVASEDTTTRQWRVKTRLRGSSEWSTNKTWGHFADYIFAAWTNPLKHGDISRTIFSRHNGAREYSENISTAKFFYVYGICCTNVMLYYMLY